MATRVITPTARISYPYLFEPQAPLPGSNAKPKYSASLVFAEGADLSTLKIAAREAAEAKWGAKAEGMIRDGSLDMPFREDWEKKGYPEGSVFINCRTERKPGVVSTFPGPDGRPIPITNPEEIYPGALVRASVTAFAYDKAGNRGVSFALNNVQKLGDAERFDSNRNAADEFDADLSQAPASLDDVL